MAPEINALLRLYESGRSVNIERIPWAPLPIQNDTPSAEDSNFCIYRTENNWAEVKDPESISFENFAKMNLEKYIWPSGLRSKVGPSVIMVPELIRGAHVHTVLHTEKRSKTVTVRKDDAIVFHLRRVTKRDNITTNGTETSGELARFIKLCDKLWSDRQKRIRDIPVTEILHAKIWPNRGLQMILRYKTTDAVIDESTVEVVARGN